MYHQVHTIHFIKLFSVEIGHRIWVFRLKTPYISVSFSSFFFFFNFILFLNLKHCISFAKHQNKSATDIHTLPILNPSPSSLPTPSLWVVPEHQLWVPCFMHPTWHWSICFAYGNIHVSMLFSQIIPPSSSPTESKSLFFTSVSLLLSRI